jgi:WD40 repeat protein
VARLAEESFSQLDGPQREAARSVLLRLAGGEESDTITRRRVPLSELDLDGNPDATAVVNRFTSDRLLTAGESTVEVAHEALLREWPRLRDWLDEDAEGRRLRIQLTQATAQWEGAGRDPTELFRGPRLSATLDWTATHGRELNSLEREFVAASRAASEQEARKQRRINRRLRGLLAAAVVLLVAAAVAGAVALVQRSHARHSATTAEAQRLGAQALTVTPPDQSFLYARESYNLEPSPATRGYLFAAEERSPAALAVVQPVAGRIRGMLPSPDRSRQLVVSNQGGGAIVDSRTLKTERSFSLAPGVVAWAGNDAVMYVEARTHELGFLDIASGRFTVDKRLPASAYSVSNGGQLLFTLPLSGASIGVVDLRTMKQLRLIRPSHGFAFDDVEPEQGRIVVAVESSLADPAAPVRYLIWLRGLSGAPSRIVLGGPGVSPFVPYAVGGRKFVVPLARGYKIVDLDSGRSSIIASDVGGTSSLALSPDGATLVLATLAHSGVAVVRVSDGTVENTFVGHQSQVHGVAFNTAGNVVFSGGADGRLIAWDLRGAHSLSTTRPLPGPGPPPNVSLPVGRLFSGAARARLVAAAMGDGTVKLLAATAPSMPLVRSIAVAPPGKPGQPTSVALDRAGDRLAVGTDDGKAVVFDAATGKRLSTKSLPARGGHPPSIVSVAFSPTGILAAAADDGRIARFPLAGGHPLPLLETTGAAEGQVGLASIVFSPDGTRLAVVYDLGPAGMVDVYDAESGRRLYTVQAGDDVYTATFTPDGKTLISGDGDGLARFWDAATGKRAGAPILVNQGQVNSLSVDPTGKTLVAGGTDGATWLFDLATRAQIGTPLGADPSTTTAALFAGPADATPVTLAFPIAGGAATLTRWNLRAGFLAARACTVARRNLTRLEWEQILPNLRYTKVCRAYPLTQ